MSYILDTACLAGHGVSFRLSRGHNPTTTYELSWNQDKNYSRFAHALHQYLENYSWDQHNLPYLPSQEPSHLFSEVTMTYLYSTWLSSVINIPQIRTCGIYNNSQYRLLSLTNVLVPTTGQNSTGTLKGHCSCLNSYLLCSIPLTEGFLSSLIQKIHWFLLVMWGVATWIYPWFHLSSESNNDPISKPSR